jgi:hypothetical protein
MSIVVRLPNAEIFLLWNICWGSILRVFTRRSKNNSDNATRMTAMTRMCLLLFCLGIIGRYTRNRSSLFQCALTPLVSSFIESVGVTQVFSSGTTSYQHSRRIAPWCFDDENTFGTVHNKFFYGCGIRASGGYYAEANSSLGFQVQADIDSYLSIFTDAQGTDFTIDKPPPVDTSIDWTGSSYATSAECVGIPEPACDIVLPIRTEPDRMRGSLSCTQYFYGEQTTGNFTLKKLIFGLRIGMSMDANTHLSRSC